MTPIIVELFLHFIRFEPGPIFALVTFAMARTLRLDVGDQIYHVINRANQRRRMFRFKKDYQRFMQVLKEGLDLFEMRLLAFCLMPNHWHLLLWPRKNGDLSKFMHWVTSTHARRYQVSKRKIGHGHIYQGRYKSHLVLHDEYFLTVCRYIERNALTANLVASAKDWPWGSLSLRYSNRIANDLLSPLPTDLPPNWPDIVDTPLTEKEIQMVNQLTRKPPSKGVFSQQT